MSSRLRNPHKLCQTIQVGLHKRRSITARRLRSDRFYVPVRMELDNVLEHDRIPFNHTCFHEHTSNTCLGRRSCHVCALGDDYRQKARRQIPCKSSNNRNDTSVYPVDICQRQRPLSLVEFQVLIIFIFQFNTLNAVFRLRKRRFFVVLAQSARAFSLTKALYLQKRERFCCLTNQSDERL